MDNRITKSRLSRVLSYDWLKILIMMVAIIFVWSLAYTVGAPRISEGQKFELYVYDCDFSKNTSESKILYDAQNAGVFSYDVLDFDSRQFTEDYFGTIMQAATSVNEGDVMVLSDFETDIESNSSVFRSFADTYYHILSDYGELCADAKNYCLKNLFVQENNGEYSLNESSIEKYFYKRMQKDPRFRTDEKKAAGVKYEIERIKNVWNNALVLEDVLKNHSEVFVSYKRYVQALAAASSDEEKQEYQKYVDSGKEKLCAIDLGKLSGGEKNITELFSHSVYKEDENGELQLDSAGADGIVMCVFDYGDQPDLKYESIAFVNYIFKTYSDFCSDNVSGLID